MVEFQHKYMQQYHNFELIVMDFILAQKNMLKFCCLNLVRLLC